MPCTNPFGLLVMALFLQRLDNVGASEKLATFYLDTTNSSRNLSLADMHTFRFRNNLPLKVIIHGWQENATRKHYLMMAQTFLNNVECYVIRIDYRVAASGQYLQAVGRVRRVGNYVGDFLVNIIRSYNIPMRMVHLIAHSLGAQVAGYAGRRVAKMTGKKLHRITGLDPAAPLFEYTWDSRRLTRKDAELVDIVHTDSGYVGYKTALGHVNFFPNGGTRWQPGCFIPSSLNPLDLIHRYVNFFFCNHHRSFIFFTASIRKTYSATRCNSWKDFRKGKCDQNKRIAFGARMSEDDNAIAGKYFFELPFDDVIIQEILAINGNV